MENEELVLCIYDENGKPVDQLITEIFKKYVMSIVQNKNY